MLLFKTRVVRAVLFDVGGVFVAADMERYVPIGCALFRTTPEPLRRKVAAHLPLLERGGMTSAQFWRLVGQELWRDGEGEEWPLQDTNFWEDIFLATLQVDGLLLHLVDQLRFQGVKVGVLSNTIADHAHILETLGFYRRFDFSVLSCKVGLRKPQREIYWLAAQMAGFPIEECLLIDDQLPNVRAAKGQGMQSWHYRDFKGLRRELERLRLLN